MDIEIVAIGNEILAGYTINSNAAFISKQLKEAGYSVKRHLVLADEQSELEIGLKEALERSEVIITTGGLGPTCDDLTREVVAKLFESDFHYNDEIFKELLKRYGDSNPAILDQATVPSKAMILKNPHGSAPGLLFYKEDKILISLPGVPSEMKPMFIEQVLPYLRKHLDVKSSGINRVLHFFNLPEIKLDPLLRLLKKKFPYLEFGIYPGSGLLSVSISALSLEQIEQEAIETSVKEITTAFSSYYFESKSGCLEKEVHDLLIGLNKTLSAAESCTGGSFSARLTKIPGASAYFLGSSIVYSNFFKEKSLGISKELLESKGAVSQEVVVEMVKKILDQTQSDYAVAVTGIAGPLGATLDKPVGTIWCAICKKGNSPIAWLLKAEGSRERIIEQSVNSLLAKLYQILKESN